MEPSVSSTGIPYTDDSSEVSQSSAKPQQPIVSEFPDRGPVLSEQPFGGPIEFNWTFSDPLSELRLGADFLSLTSGSLFIAVVFPPSPRRLLQDLAAGSNTREFGRNFDSQFVAIPTHSRRKSDSSGADKPWFVMSSPFRHM